MRLAMKVLIGILAVILVVVLYVATIGSSIQVHDFNTPDDANTVAYATMSLKYSVTFTMGIVETYVLVGDVQAITASVFPYVSPDEGMVFKDGTGVLSPMPPSPSYGEFWIEVHIIGPEGYSSDWASSPLPILLEVEQLVEETSGRAYFDVAGVYTAKATLYGLLDIAAQQQALDSRTIAFTVD